MEEHMAMDPVCGMSVDEKSAAATSSYKGKTYYFCSEDCKKLFDKQPDTYAKQSATTAS
jgi:Cu+-exporting ATPase